MTGRAVGWLAELAERYRKKLLESVIPFWMRHCLDRDFGGFHVPRALLMSWQRLSKPELRSGTERLGACT